MPTPPNPELVDAARRVLTLADHPRVPPMPADADAAWLREWTDAFEALRFSVAAQSGPRS